MKTFLCECGCGVACDGRKLRPVRVSEGPPRCKDGRMFQDARSYRVRPQCVQPFMLELRTQERLRVTMLRVLKLPRRQRLRFLPGLWLLRRTALLRRLGPKVSRRQAWGTVWFALRAPRSGA